MVINHHPFDEPISMTLGECDINTKILNAILGFDLSNPDSTWSVEYIKHVQARTHRKKRINKKWLKRYGYKSIPVIIGKFKMKLLEQNSEEDISNYTVELERP